MGCLDGPVPRAGPHPENVAVLVGEQDPDDVGSEQVERGVHDRQQRRLEVEMTQDVPGQLGHGAEGLELGLGPRNLRDRSRRGLRGPRRSSLPRESSLTAHSILALEGYEDAILYPPGTKADKAAPVNTLGEARRASAGGQEQRTWTCPHGGFPWRTGTASS